MILCITRLLFNSITMKNSSKIPRYSIWICSIWFYMNRFMLIILGLLLLITMNFVLVSEQDVWIGATDEDEEGAWVFTDGANYPPTSVMPEPIHTQHGQHDQDCARIVDRQIRDHYCSRDRYRYLCMVNPFPG